MKEMNIFYKVNNGLYVNLTNKCPCSCVFCLRNTMDSIKDSGKLWLDHTPSWEEIERDFSLQDLSSYDEVVFCGFGEPTEALDNLLRLASLIKKQKPSIKIRVNTNGLGSLVNSKNIAPLFEGLVDSVSISLNTPNKEQYLKIVRPRFGEESFEAMLSFAGEVKNYVPLVTLTTVKTVITEEEERQCAEICKNLGVIHRIRPFES